MPRVDTFQSPRGASVGLYSTGTEIPSGSRPDFFAYDDPHIRVREILFLDDRILLYRQPDPDADWEIEEIASATPVVEEFFLDIFNRKAGLGA